MALWMVRAGRQGEREDLCLEHNVAVMGWEELPDLSGVTEREELARVLRETYPDEKPKTVSNWESQFWPFLRKMEEGDLVALPLKGRSAIVIGKVTGPYTYRPDFPIDARHTRPVKWEREFPRSAFDQDLLYSFGAFLTVCSIHRNNAEERVRAKLEGRPPPPTPPPGGDGPDVDGPLDLEEYARDQIRQYIGQKFRGHGLAGLVAAVLTAQGYKVKVSPEGPDGGVDIIAGRGPLGFESPRLAVQVKSGDTPVDVKVLRELQGVMKNFGADQGLLVAWGGYRSSVDKEGARLFFEIRLWDADDLVRMVQANYDDLSAELQAELPLTRIWTLVLSEG